MSQKEKYEKRFNLKIESDKAICLDCNAEITGLMTASGNKTAEGDCSKCYKVVKIPVENFYEIRSHKQ